MVVRQLPGIAQGTAPNPKPKPKLPPPETTGVAGLCNRATTKMQNTVALFTTCTFADDVSGLKPLADKIFRKVVDL